MSQPNRFELAIIVTAEGAVQVRGPINDKVLCYGLLDALKAHHDQLAQQQSSGIVPARAVDPFLLNQQRQGKSS